MARTGRPKKDSVREKKITIRLSDEEHANLHKYAEEHDKTVTEVVLEALLLLSKKIKA